MQYVLLRTYMQDTVSTTGFVSNLVRPGRTGQVARGMHVHLQCQLQGWLPCMLLVGFSKAPACTTAM